ncbi:MAG: hypothetical protein Q8W45_00665 [Candidatus Palauibacterales bacterium]|nr:hypothetical protein [Candidatus Palauibacterales bacterium]
MLSPTMAGGAPPADGPEGGATAPGRQPFLVGRRAHGTSTIWFLRPVSPPLPGPWDVALLLQGT